MSDFMLNKLLYFEIDVIGAVLTLIMYGKSTSSSNFRTSIKSQSLFRHMLINIFFVFILDGVSWVINGYNSQGYDIIHTIVLVLYFLLTPMIGYLWLIYVYSKLYTDYALIKKFQMLHGVIIFINIILSVLSPITKDIFYVNSQGFYQRGDLYFLSSIICVSFYISSILAVLVEARKRKDLFQEKTFKYVLLFPILPLLGMFVQVTIQGLAVVYICVMFSYLIIFINVQNEQIYTDQATGLYNRGYLNSYIQEKSNALKKGGKLSLMLIDLDYFKNLNDTFGHTAGDQALRDVSNILLSSLEQQIDCVSRYGGDEFVIVIKRDNEEEIHQAVKNIEQGIKEFNDSGKRKYKLACSIGYTICDKSDKLDLDSLLKQADENMYLEKMLHHNNN